MPKDGFPLDPIANNGSNWRYCFYDKNLPFSLVLYANMLEWISTLGNFLADDVNTCFASDKAFNTGVS